AEHRGRRDHPVRAGQQPRDTGRHRRDLPAPRRDPGARRLIYAQHHQPRAGGAPGRAHSGHRRAPHPPPVGGVTAVALLIGIRLIAMGVIRFVTAFDEYRHRGWHALAGALELIAGIVIVANPNIGYTTLAILVGIGFIVNGIGLTALGWGIRDIRHAAS